jgi:hypothetical protein
LIHAFSERWGDEKEDCHWLYALDSIKREENETMNEFNELFNDFIHDLPDSIRPPNIVILIYYMELSMMRFIINSKIKSHISLRILNPKPIKSSQTCKLQEDLVYLNLPWAILKR